MRYQNNKSNNFDQIFLNVHLSITIAHNDFKFYLLSPHIHSEGTMSHFLNLGLSFYFMSTRNVVVTAEKNGFPTL